jgi:type II secretory pathway predicted ATPase ExeA
MMEAYFGLKRLPFDRDIKSSDLIASFDSREAEARLNHVKQYRGIMCLTGEPGSGKTSIVRKWVDDLNPQSFLHCYTPHVTVSRSELYRQTNSLLNLPSKCRKSDLFRQIQAAIWHQYTHGKVTVLVLDECQMMDHATLQELVLLTNFEMDSRLPFILLLIGQPEFKDILSRSIHEPLRQRINLRYHMSGLGMDETKAYVEGHLRLVGRIDPLFDDGTFAVLHQLSSGLPRKINKLCLAAMQLVMSERRKLITPDDILKVATEQ